MIVDVSQKTERLRKDSESIIKHQERLQTTAADLLKDVHDKKSAIQYTQDQAKELVHTIKNSQEHIMHAFKQSNTDKYKV
ncbi:hypothetical protein GCM10011391_31100 [Pullulanibacillus camelliae]|uniref:Uncharacterized protein n=1 Tax=Pullulanibacillus camelliae TaxID=1707096 RepID=A0A8J2YKK6_9BACL|nr:hypothetical protein GCM10011391_31100 [Pullulanibacillus camelliae]